MKIPMVQRSAPLAITIGKLAGASYVRAHEAPAPFAGHLPCPSWAASSETEPLAGTNWMMTTSPVLAVTEIAANAFQGNHIQTGMIAGGDDDEIE
jgi:hypothetical protein